MQNHRTGTVTPTVTVDRLDPGDILTPDELAERLKVAKSWVFEKTRRRALVRDPDALPCIRMGKYLRFHWPDVCQWLARKRDL